MPTTRVGSNMYERGAKSNCRYYRQMMSCSSLQTLPTELNRCVPYSRVTVALSAIYKTGEGRKREIKNRSLPLFPLMRLDIRFVFKLPQNEGPV
jgi:hypothetical protein